MPSVREMVASDVPLVLKIIEASSKIDARAASRYFKAYFNSVERQEDCHEQLFIATRDAIVDGIAGFAPDRYRTSGLLWMSWLYVDVHHQRQGIGTRLMKHCLQEARKLKIRKMCLETSSHPIYQASVRLYERLGFTRDGYVDDYYEPGQDLILMSIALH